MLESGQEVALNFPTPQTRPKLEVWRSCLAKATGPPPVSAA
jgi:hypothetical protein